ncbi:MAG: ShlB/FhaC/HecB family hemolysin secretion/activation protein [Pseudohongiella sp.]|nr:ShlB/FhaC/HecB family hemolysin secretion/activation protein [Pseudohongiella sp.]
MNISTGKNRFHQHALNLKKSAMSVGITTLLLTASPVFAQAPVERFDINRFVVEGNSLLQQERIDAILQPYTGTQKDYSDVQRATTALQNYYSSVGSNIVWVVVPEQDLDNGVVRLRVVEARIGAVSIAGNDSFDNDNIRASLPALVEGTSPSTEAISANIQLANSNPAKQVDVMLRPGTQEGLVDAVVNVLDENAFKAFVTLDNTGNPQTGDYRLGVGIQHANLFNSDHVGTLSFVTSPDNMDQVQQYSASYRVPMYKLDDSLDFIAGYSDVDAGTTQTVAGPLAFSGKGAVYGFRYNQLLARQGEYSHKLVYGIDYRAYENVCSLGIFGEAGCGPAAVDVTVRPVSISYNGSWARPGRAADFYVGYAHNLAGASNGDSADFNAARPSPTGGVGASSQYDVMRAGASFVQAFAGNWQYRVALNAQYTADALITGEQFGTTGATTVRGFLEREIARDIGHVVNVEVNTPNLMGTLIPGNSNLRALAFYDGARSRNNKLGGEDHKKSSIGSLGLGLRWNLQRNLNARIDIAKVVDGDGSQKRGDYHGHFSIYLGF